VSGVLRGHGATVLVAALAAAFGVGLLGATEVILLASEVGPLGAIDDIRLVLGIIAMAFTAIAIYVAAIVTTNTVSTIVVGRIRQIALVRLLGGTAARQRRRIAAEGLTAGALGAGLGMLAAWALVGALVLVGVATGNLPERDYPYLVASMAVPVLAVVLSTWLAARVGSRRVLAVAPIQALVAAVPADEDEIRGRRARIVWALVLGITGVLLLALAVVLGQLTPFALLIGILGGAVSFTGFMLGAVRVVPGVLAVVGRLLGSGPAALLGSRNALRHRERSTRAAMGLVIGVALVTMLVIAWTTVRRIALDQALASWGEDGAAEFDAALGPILAVVATLVGYSAIIAAVGLVSTLTVGVLQRTREFGMVRALGLSRGQLRRSITVEAVQLAVTAVLIGVVLGVAYGWVGAQAVGGSQQVAGMVPPQVPWWLLVGVAVIAGILALAGSRIPARRALRISPVEAIAVE